MEGKFSAAVALLIPPTVYKQREHMSGCPSTNDSAGNMGTDLLAWRELPLNFPFLFWFGFWVPECGQLQSSLNGRGGCSNTAHGAERVSQKPRTGHMET